MSWTPHGSNSDYWRSDNPLLIAWYRCGDEALSSVENRVIDDGGKRSYVSGLLVDSGPRQYHLLHTGDPDDYLLPISGIAPWSTSGMIIGENPSTSWVQGAHTESIWIDSQAWHESGNDGSRGLHPVSFGTETLPSGWTFMSWMRLSQATTNQTTIRPIFTDYETDFAQGGADSSFRIGFRFSTRTFHITIKFNNGTQVTLETTDNPFTPGEDQDFFLAVQMHREDAVPGGWWNTVVGSGVLDVYLGTAVSGLTKIDTLEFSKRVIRHNKKVETPIYWTFGQDARPSRDANTNINHLPPGCAFDEIALVADGRMSEDRIAYYMNSGIVQFASLDPGHPDFQPVEPGDDDLVAYWTFDANTGVNSSPSTSGVNDIVFGSSATIEAVPGIRGGSGIAVGDVTLRNAPLSDQEDFPHVPFSDSINSLFPDINVSDQWTWIGWLRARSDGTSHYGGSIGFFNADAADEHTAWGIGDWTNAFANTGGIDRGRGLEWSPSGTAPVLSSGPNTSDAEEGGNLIGPLAAQWQLWALVFDYRNGFIYSVRDAKNVKLETFRISSVSGLSKDEIDSSSAFILSSIANGASNQYAEFDDWAIFQKKLSLAEMSGYAVSGIDTRGEISNYATSDVKTLGYWRCENSGSFGDSNDPKYNDSSFYVHNLTNLSGVFTQTTALNTDTETNATKVEVSGSMLSLSRLETGANLDFSQEYLFAQSGFSCGVTLYVPSGDFGDVDNANTSGIVGDHHIIGSWDQSDTQRSWQLGLRDHVPYIRLRTPTSNELVEATIEIPFNQTFFLGAQILPSGGVLRTEIFFSDDITTEGDTQLIGNTNLTLVNHLNPVGASGFSLLNVPHMEQGFPSGTIIQHPFVYAGPLEADGFDQVKRLGFQIITINSGQVSISDAANISHWRLDSAGDQFTDFGQAQNALSLINAGGDDVNIQPAIHNNGAQLREAEYLTTLPNNPGTSGLDLGETDSFTVLGWLKPNSETAGGDDEVIFSKHPTRGQGYQTYIESGDDILQINSAGVTTSGNNTTTLARGGWHHVAFVHEKAANRQTVIVDGRYAGTSFTNLVSIPANSSGFALGGRGSPNFEPVAGGAAFSGILDDWMVFERALTLPEISGLAANTYDFNDSATPVQGFVGGWVSGVAQNIISGIVGSWIHGQAQDIELAGGYISGVQGVLGHHGGWIRGRAFVEGFLGGFTHGSALGSGVFGHYIRGMDIASGVIGTYVYGGCDTNGHFDIAFTFQIVDASNFDARLGVELTRSREFDARLGLFRITAPPTCTLEFPYPQTVVSGLPYLLTVQGSGAALDGKSVDHVRFTFADFKEAASGNLIAGHAQSGFYEATREIATQGLYTVKIEVIDEFGYRTSCAQQILIIGSGDTMPTSGEVISGFPGFELAASTTDGTAKEIVSFTHSISGINTTSGILEYMDFGDGQTSLVNITEMPDTNIFGKTLFGGVRRHEYSSAGKFTPVWAASGSWGVVSDTLRSSFDFLNF